MQWDLLINPIVGGIIGYATNYLAIKMLFRPHHTKYIGNIKIPFTPGLIPKEKAALARQMGEIIEEHLLNEDVLVDTLTGDKTKDVFFKFINEIPTYMEESDKTIQEVARDVFGEDINQSGQVIIDQFALEMITMLNLEEVTDVVVPYIVDTIEKAINYYFTDEQSSESIVQSIKQLAKEALEGEKAKLYIYDVLEELEQTTYTMLQDHASDIGRGIITAIATGEQAEKIKETLQDWADENFNPMVSMFIKIDKIYEGIIEFANHALDDPERSEKFGTLLCTVVKNLLGDDGDYKDQVIDIIKHKIDDANIKIVIEIIKDELAKKEGNTKAEITKWVYTEWNRYINSEEFFEISKKILQRLGEFIGETSLTNLSMIIPKGTKDEINQKLFDLYKKIITNNSKEVAKVMDISHLVEGKINEFSSEEAEKVILSVVKKQLKGITWIGGLLGVIIGIISNLLG